MQHSDVVKKSSVVEIVRHTDPHKHRKSFLETEAKLFGGEKKTINK